MCYAKIYAAIMCPINTVLNYSAFNGCMLYVVAFMLQLAIIVSLSQTFLQIKTSEFSTDRKW